MSQSCSRAGLHLTGIIPATAVLHAQLQQLPVGQEEFALLTAETGGLTTVVLGRRDGELVLGRTLLVSWTKDAKSFIVDINRTVLFANEQLRTPPKGVWLFGPGARDHLESIQSGFRVPVALSPEEPSAAYWAERALRLPAEHGPNLISPEQREAPQRRRRVTLVSALTLLLLIGSIATSLHFQWMIREEKHAIAAQQRRLNELQSRQKELNQRLAELNERRAVNQLVIQQRVPAIPLWFLGYLGEAVPRDLLLTNLDVQLQGGVWQVRIGGTLQPTAGPPPPQTLTDNVASLKQRLEAGPFHL